MRKTIRDTGECSYGGRREQEPLGTDSVDCRVNVCKYPRTSGDCVKLLSFKDSHFLSLLGLGELRSGTEK